MGERHRGDIMSPETRSLVMSRIRGRDTGPERAMAEVFRQRALPGRAMFGICRDVRTLSFGTSV